MYTRKIRIYFSVLLLLLLQTVIYFQNIFLITVRRRMCQKEKFNFTTRVPRAYKKNIHIAAREVIELVL